MNRFLLALFSTLVLSVAVAQSFSVVVQPLTAPFFGVEYAQPVHESVDLLVGVDFAVLPMDVDVALGARYRVFAGEDADVFTVGRLQVPVADAAGFSFGYPHLALGVILLPISDSPGTTIFEAGMRTRLDATLFSTIPHPYVRAGFSFNF